MFEKLLYSTDFSDVAVKALEYVKILKILLGAVSEEVISKSKQPVFVIMR